MKYNIIFVCIILIVLSISAVNAIDENNTLHSDNTQNNNILLYDANIQSGKSMNELKNIIDSSPDKVKLTSDFLYNYSKDNDLEEGIPITKSMTIDGQGHKIDANHKMKIFQIRDNANVVFKNIVLLNGGGIYGGAICNHAKTPVCVENSTFIYNHCVIDGGAIYSEGDVIIKNCLFDNNIAKGSSKQCYGGAIRSKNTVSIDNSTFKNNYAEDYGGAIYANTITWINTLSYFIGNCANDNQGGAIYTNKFNNDVSNAFFINNNVNSNDDGGAIYINEENTVTFSHCLFEGNHCGDEGGAIYLDSRKSHLTLKNNNFINNGAGDEGQCVFNKGYYNEITDNFWNDMNPSTENDQLVEWKQWGENIKHADKNPSPQKILKKKNI